MTFPATSILDRFNRANQALDVSPNWSNPLIAGSGSALRIVTNEVDTGGAFSTAYWDNAISGEANEVYVTLRGVGIVGTNIYLFVRMSNPNTGNTDGYAVRFHQTGVGVGTVWIYRIDNSASVVLHNQGANFALGDVVGARVNGTTITTYQNGSSLNSAVDATYSDGEYIGLGVSAGVVDDFGGGNFYAIRAGSGCAGGLEASQILVPDTGGEYKAYSLLSLTQRLLRATAGTGMAPHHFITQRGPLQDGDSPLDMRWDAGTLQLLIADSQLNRTDYYDARDALVRLLRPNRSFGWPDGVVRPLIFRKWLPYGRQEFGTDLALTAGSNLVTSNTGRFVERGLDPGCVLTITGTTWDNGAYVIEDVPNDYTLQLSANMIATATGGHWNYMRRWGKRDLYCLLEEGPRFDQGPGPQPFIPNGFSEALRFVAYEPFWFGPEQTETWVVEAVDALVFDTDGTSTVRSWFGKVRGQGFWFFGVSSVSEAIEVVYWGTVGAKPVFTITGPAISPIIANNTTGVEIEMAYTVAAGETVTIDTLAQTITNNAGENLQPYADGDLATFEIVPRPQAPDGVNVIHVSFTGGVTGESDITMTWRNRYESLH